MKRKVALSIVVMGFLMTSVFLQVGMAVKPPKANLSVNMSEPIDGLSVATGGSFDVSGTVQVSKGDAGEVRAYVQYSRGEGTSNFVDVEGMYLSIEVGLQPQSDILLRDELYSTSWTLTGQPGTYEIRIYAESDRAKSGSSSSSTITIESPPPPPGLYYVTNEYQDSTIGYGIASGSYSDTYLEDGIYEILSEEKNTHGTKKPVDDTTEIGWIYDFTGLDSRIQTTLHIVGHALTTADDSDTGFEIQWDYDGTWITLTTIESNLPDLEYVYDIIDDSSTSLRFRFVDDDREVGNKEISMLFIDRMYISNSSVPQQWTENVIADLPVGVGFRTVEIGDIDDDPEN
ncbi:MAG: hypothetical protein ACW98Y_20535, partial [Candidatus Thorarchaeota archaeon]